MDELYTGHRTWEVASAQVDQLYDGGLAPDPALALQPNQFLTLIDLANPSHTALARFMVYHFGFCILMLFDL